jgi:hypothetical protein
LETAVSPDQIAALTALSSFFANIGTWPLGSVAIVIVFGPWVAMGFISRSIEKRHEAAVKMYEDNVKLVINYEKVSRELQGILVLTTQTMTQVKERIDNNLFCPIMRKDQKVERQA